MALDTHGLDYSSKTNLIVTFIIVAFTFMSNNTPSDAFTTWGRLVLIAIGIYVNWPALIKKAKADYTKINNYIKNKRHGKK